MKFFLKYTRILSANDNHKNEPPIDLRILSAGDTGSMWEGVALLKTKEKRRYPFSVTFPKCESHWMG